VLKHTQRPKKAASLAERFEKAKSSIFASTIPCILLKQNGRELLILICACGIVNGSRLSEKNGVLKWEVMLEEIKILKAAQHNLKKIDVTLHHRAEWIREIFFGL
jgi:hypothetical protein